MVIRRVSLGSQKSNSAKATMRDVQKREEPLKKEELLKEKEELLKEKLAMKEEHKSPF